MSLFIGQGLMDTKTHKIEILKFTAQKGNATPKMQDVTAKADS